MLKRDGNGIEIIFYRNLTGCKIFKKNADETEQSKNDTKNDLDMEHNIESGKGVIIII